MINGRAFIKLYKDFDCTAEVSKVGGNYFIDVRDYSSIGRNLYEIPLYARNEGSHNAYHLSLLVDPNIGGVSSNIVKEVLRPNEKYEFTVGISTSALPYDIENINVRLSYDNIQYRR